jgi:hypothetical protein
LAPGEARIVFASYGPTKDVHPAVPELVNLQEVGGKCKPYQVKQVLKLVERYNLRLSDEP